MIKILLFILNALRSPYDSLIYTNTYTPILEIFQEIINGKYRTKVQITFNYV